MRKQCLTRVPDFRKWRSDYILEKCIEHDILGRVAPTSIYNKIATQSKGYIFRFPELDIDIDLLSLGSASYALFKLFHGVYNLLYSICRLLP